MKWQKIILTDGVSHDNHYALDEHGNIWEWGSQKIGTAGSVAPNPLPRQITTGVRFVDISTRGAALDEDQRLWVWHEAVKTNKNDNPEDLEVPTIYERFPQWGDGTRWLKIQRHSGGGVWALASDGYLTVIGHNFLLDTYSYEDVHGAQWKDFYVGSDYLLAIDKDSGKLYGGRNSSGPSWVPVSTAVNPLSPIESVENVSFRKFAPLYGLISSGGDLWQFDPYELSGADGSPVKFETDKKWVDAGGNIALDTDGNFWGWGENSYGNLGVGDFEDRSEPVLISSLPKSQSAVIATEFEASAVITDDGELRLAGSNSSYSLGVKDTGAKSNVFIGLGEAALSPEGYMDALRAYVDMVAEAKDKLHEKFQLQGVPFRQYAENIHAMLYLCTYVNRTYETGEFTVSGLPDDAFKDLADWEGNPYPEEYRTKNPNGTYAPYYKEGELSNWKFKNEHGTVVYWNGEWSAWVFAPFAQGEDDNYWLIWFPARGRCEHENMKYPWDSSIEWVDGNTDSPISGLAIAPVVPAPVEQYWKGYQLVWNAETGNYAMNIEEKKLTYGDFMPVAGRFYDADCTMEVGYPNLAENLKYSTPTNMTSNENFEWLITASHELTETYYPNAGVKHPAWQAFDGRTDKDWNTDGDSSSNTFIQWQNKTHKVLLKQLDIYGYDWEELPKLNEGKAYLEGSNDGETWKQLTVTLPDGFNYYDRCASFKLTNNYEFFSYYRIRYYNGTYRWVITEIKGTYLNEREVPK